MPIQFDSIVNFPQVKDIGICNKLFSDPITTAITLTMIMIAMLVLFFPLKKNKFEQYFKIIIYYGLITSVSLTIHDSIITKNVEGRFHNEESIADDLPDKITITPRISGGNEEKSNEAVEIHNEKELDDIITSLETEDIFTDDLS